MCNINIFKIVWPENNWDTEQDYIKPEQIYFFGAWRSVQLIKTTVYRAIIELNTTDEYNAECWMVTNKEL